MTQSKLLAAVEEYCNSNTRDKLIVMGDFNAQLVANVAGQTGKWCLRKSLDTMTLTTRRSSRRLHDFLRNTDMWAMNTMECARVKKWSQLATWRVPGTRDDGTIAKVTLDWIFGTTTSDARRTPTTRVRCRRYRTSWRT